MPGRPSQSRSLEYVGAVVAVVAVVGYAAFDWRFGETGVLVPVVIGVIAALIAVGSSVYRRR